MPLSLEPNQEFCVSLDIDADKPIASRPVFVVHCQPMRGHLRILQVLDRWHEEGVTLEQLFDDTCKELQRVIVGYKNMGGFTVEADIRDLLSYDEARELLRKIASNAHLKPDEKKSLE